MKLRELFCSVAILLGAVWPAYAQPSLGLDPNFRPSITRPDGAINAVAIQADGKIVIGGSFNEVNGHARTNLARLNRDGTLDPNYPGESLDLRPFVLVMTLQADGKLLCWKSDEDTGGDTVSLLRLDNDGKLDPGFPAGVWRARAGRPVRLLLQKSGKIVIFGHSSGPDLRRSSPRLIRLNADGTHDSTFQPQNGPDDPESIRIPLAVLPDDKVLIWARAGDLGLGLFRLSSDGSQDTDFSAKLTSTDLYSEPQAAVRNDGRIVLAGNFTEVNGVRRSGVALLNPDGTLDGRFNPGRGLADLESYEGLWISSLFVQPSGSVLIGGAFSHVDGKPRYGFARLHSDGSLDQGFDASLAGGGDFPRVLAMAVDAEGRLVLGGRFWSVQGQRRDGLARLNLDGRLDEGVAPRLGTVSGAVRDMAEQPDGKILIGGSFGLVNGTVLNSVARLNPDGTVDPGFQPDTSVSASVGAIAIQSDGKMLVGGYPYLMVRLNADGTRDKTFNVRVENVWGIHLQTDGKAVIWGGFGKVAGRDFFGHLARLNVGGSLDESFQPAASLSYPNAAQAVAFQSDGKMVFHARPSKIVRLAPDGALDAAWNAPALSEIAYLNALAFQRDGKLIVSGTPQSGGVRRLIRLNQNGVLDPAFNATIQNEEGSGSVASITAEPDGRILIGGNFSAVNGVPRRGIARLKPDGGLDETFKLTDAPFEAPIWRIVPMRNSRHLISGGYETGFALLRPAPVIHVTSGTRSPFAFTIGGQSGWTYRIETSTDLMNWTPLREVPSAGTQTGFNDTPAADQRNRYYRVSLR